MPRVGRFKGLKNLMVRACFQNVRGAAAKDFGRERGGAAGGASRTGQNSATGHDGQENEAPQPNGEMRRSTQWAKRRFQNFVALSGWSV